MKISKINNGNINDVFILEFDYNKYIIRMSQFNNDFECKILKLLDEYNIDSPRLLTNFKLGSKNIMICKYTEGENPTIYNELFFEKLANSLRKLHSIQCKFEPVDYANNEETLSKLKKYYGLSITSRYLKDETEFINKKYKEIEKLNLNYLPKNIIHSDVKKENLLVNDNELYLIDFGNAYVGNRLIDLIRVIMWFFIKDNNYDFDSIEKFILQYFKKNSTLLEAEKSNVTMLIKYCILYNLLKDVYLYEKNIINSDYIENNSLIWLDALKNEKKLIKIGEAFKNA